MYPEQPTNCYIITAAYILFLQCRYNHFGPLSHKLYQKSLHHVKELKKAKTAGSHQLRTE